MKSLEDHGPVSFIWTAASQISPSWAWNIWSGVSSLHPASFCLILLDPECFLLNLVPSLDTEMLTVLLPISLLWATRPTLVSKPCHCLELGSLKLLISHFPTLSNTLGFCFLTHTQPRWNWMFLRSLEFVCSAYIFPLEIHISVFSLSSIHQHWSVLFNYSFLPKTCFLFLASCLCSYALV